MPAPSITLRIWMPKLRIEKSTIVRDVFGSGAQTARSAALGTRNGSAALLRGQGARAGLRHSVAGAGVGSARGMQRVLDAFGLELGHASIKLPDAFVGYWGPQAEYGEQGRAILAEADEDDLIDREPDHVFELAGLDVPAMRMAWQQAREVDYHVTRHNCCTVCHRVIKAGVDGKRAKLSFIQRCGYGIGEGILSVFNPLTTLNAASSEVVAEGLFAWTPPHLKQYATYVREVFLKI